MSLQHINQLHFRLPLSFITWPGHIQVYHKHPVLSDVKIMASDVASQAPTS